MYIGFSVNNTGSRAQRFNKNWQTEKYFLIEKTTFGTGRHQYTYAGVIRVTRGELCRKVPKRGTGTISRQ